MEKLLKYKEAAAMLGIGTPALRRWVKEGRVVAVKMTPKYTRFKIADLEAAIDAARTEAE